ncbi:hypothetical protein GY45DRAFT_1096754 [Cubamyces sp. BRFM 1775]|nr:hypothetical protein GY45DRAFT_1096754 [Cubamyces sp. BRFM 1775]
MQDVREYCPLPFVCSHWYQPITGRPSLWLTVVNYVEPRQERSLYIDYISRCSSGPLSIFIQMGSTPLDTGILATDNVRLTLEVCGCAIQPTAELDEEDETDNEDGDEDDGDDEMDDTDDEPGLAAPGNTHRARIRLGPSLFTSMLSAIRHLRIGKGGGWTLIQPSSVILTLPLLEGLVVADPGQRYGGRLWYTITEILDAYIPISDGTVVCPALKRVKVDCADAGCVDARESSDADNPGPLLQKYKELMVTRRLAGHLIDRFFLFFVHSGVHIYSQSHQRRD